MNLDFCSPQICILDASLDNTRLSTCFIKDVYATFEKESYHNPDMARLTHQTIAYDVFNGAVSRETVTRIINDHYDSKWFSPTVTFSLIGSVLLRPTIKFTTTRHVNRPAQMSTQQRVEILNMLANYGVRCATGHCCDFLKLPKELSRDRIPA